MKRFLALSLVLLFGLLCHSQSTINQAVINNGASQTPEQVAATIVSGQSLTWYGYSASCITYSGGMCSTPSGGSTIVTWDDESGNGNNLGCSGNVLFQTNQVNSLPATQEGSGGTALCAFGSSFTASSDITVFVVMKQTTISTAEDVIEGMGGIPNAFSYSIASSQQRVCSAQTACGHGTSTLSSATWYQLAANYNQTTANFWVGSSSDGNSTISSAISAATTGLFQGSDGDFVGYTALVFIFTGSAVVNGTNTTNMLAALHARYGT